jgi:hypothetical protein
MFFSIIVISESVAEQLDAILPIRVSLQFGTHAYHTMVVQKQ